MLSLFQSQRYFLFYRPVMLGDQIVSKFFDFIMIITSSAQAVSQYKDSPKRGEFVYTPFLGFRCFPSLFNQRHIAMVSLFQAQRYFLFNRPVMLGNQIVSKFFDFIVTITSSAQAIS